jgi:hypothetical protein
MERVAQLAPRDTKPKRAPEKPFAAVEFPNNPWSLCKQYQGTIAVTYGHLHGIARLLTRQLSEGQKYLSIEKRLITRFPDGRAFHIRFRTKVGHAIGGTIWLQDSRGRRITIYDAKSFFQINWAPLKRLYGTDDLALIMERTRSSLRTVGLRSSQQDWSRCSSITAYLWKKLEIDLDKVPCINVRRREPGNLQGYNVFGHTDRPAYFYDIHSAYLSEMYKFEELRRFADFLWKARQELTQANDPAAYVLKLAATIIPGKFTSTLPNNALYRPLLGKFIRQQVNDRLRAAMEHVEDPSERYRWCVDGFIAARDISKYLDIGSNLGQWKPVEVEPHLTIVQTNLWWAGNKHKDGGYRGIQEQQVLENPFEIHAQRVTFDWTTLEERYEPVVLYQNHYEEHCKACRGQSDLHDRVARNVILIREEDFA